jgi:uncharacterized damage-inducible protein DinB
MNEIPLLIAAYEEGVPALQQAVANLAFGELRARPIEGKWSVHEVVCHIADFEIINADRLKRIIAEEHPTLFNAEPDPFVAALAYDARDTASELALIAAIRKHVATILKTLQPQQWQRTGLHSTAGALTLVQLLQRATKHIPHHLPFIAEKRALMGK